MHIPIEYIAAALLVSVVLQTLSVLLANLEVAAKKIDAHKVWTAPDGSVFADFAVEQIAGSSVMQHEIEHSGEETLCHSI
jgi:hypothetical protein